MSKEHADRLPWGKFVWAHWENDEALALCSMGAQGLWMRLLCIAVKEDGYVLVGDKPPTVEKLARIVRAGALEVQSWLDELETEGVFSRTGEGVIYSRRMVREAKNARRNRQNGAKGGNPSLRKTSENGASDNPPAQPPRQPPAKKGVKADKIREESERDSSEPKGSGAKAPSTDWLNGLRNIDRAAAVWQLGVRLLMDRGGYTQARAKPMVGKWVKDHGAEQLWPALEAAWNCATLDPVSYVAAALKRVDEEAADFDPMLTPEDWRQRKWMAEFVEGVFQWNPQRGPEPGQPGCRVSAEIQREFGVEPAKPQPVKASA